MFVSSVSPMAIEYAASLGYDFVIIDCEHGLFGFDGLITLLHAAASTPLKVLVRIAPGEWTRIGPTLDVGAHGVVVPMVNSAAEAQRAVAACRYPPEGSRGFGPLRAALHIPGTPSEVNRKITCCVMIETVEAVAAADEICATPGLDAVLIGPGDLAMSLGIIPGQKSDELAEAIQTAVAACQRHGVPSIIAARTVSDVAAAVAAGHQMISVCSDVAVLRDGLTNAIGAAREALATRAVEVMPHDR
jgi:4-hydroxy-2-oxoheptanedioate aldolase